MTAETSKPTDIAITELPFETEQLRIELARFLDQAFELKAGPDDAHSIRLVSRQASDVA